MALVVTGDGWPPSTRRRVRWLTMLPLFWIVTGVLGIAFAVAPRDAGQARVPPAIDWPLQAGPVGFLAVAAVMIALLPRARLAALLFVVANLCLLLGMRLLATMQVTGAWL